MSITYPAYREADSEDDGAGARPSAADILEDEFDDEFEETLRRELIAAGLLDE